MIPNGFSRQYAESLADDQPGAALQYCFDATVKGIIEDPARYQAISAVVDAVDLSGEMTILVRGWLSMAAFVNDGGRVIFVQSPP